MVELELASLPPNVYVNPGSRGRQSASTGSPTECLGPSSPPRFYLWSVSLGIFSPSASLNTGLRCSWCPPERDCQTPYRRSLVSALPVVVARRRPKVAVHVVSNRLIVFWRWCCHIGILDVGPGSLVSGPGPLPHGHGCLPVTLSGSIYRHRQAQPSARTLPVAAASSGLRPHPRRR